MQVVERAFSRRLAAEFQRVATEAAGSIHHAFDVHRHTVNVRNIVRDMRITAGGMFIRAYFGTKKTAQLPLEKKVNTEDEVLNFTVSNAAKRADKIADDVAESTKRKIRRSIVSGLAENLAPRQVAARIIERVGGDFGYRRALTIARTETHAAANEALLESANTDADVLETKEWVSTADDRTREAHKHANGQTVKLDKPFTVDGEHLRFPGDPDGSPENIINCRCQIVFS